MPLDHLYQTLKADRLQRFEGFIADGTYRPFTYPWDTLPALWLFLGLLILPRWSHRKARLLRPVVVLVIFLQGLWTCLRCRSIGIAGGYGIGLVHDWGFIMTGALLVYNDVKTDFRRLESRPGEGHRERGQENGSTTAVHEKTGEGARLRQGMNQSKTVTTEPGSAKVTESPLVWQSYPEPIWHGVCWIIDLITNFRGVNWNYRLPIFAPMEGIPESSSSEPQSHTSSAKVFPTESSIEELRRKAVRRFVVFYLATDLIKTICIHDPYFLGLASLDSPNPMLLLQPHSFITKLVRLVFALISVVVVLSLIFSLCPLFFSYIPRLLPASVPQMPLADPAMYPPFWSPTPISDIARSGLPAFWSRVWHQMFRFGISQPAVYLTKNIPQLTRNPRSQTARAVQLFTAFLATASIHAVAASTSFPPNPEKNPPRPLTGSGWFFILQAGGIILQTAVSKALVGKEKDRWPLWVRKMGNVVFVVVWLWYTGPILADDFARCGVWMFEPVPFSLSRGLLGEGWWQWGGRWAGWAWGDDVPWYRRGIAIY